MRSKIVATAVAAALAVPIGTAAGAPPKDRTIDLPAGFNGEGVARGRGDTFYAGSRTDGRIARGDISERESDVWVADPPDDVPAAIGLKADVRHGLLWVSGGGTGKAVVYDLDTAGVVEVLTLTTAPSFINDVTVTRDAAYYTNSLAPELYRVPVSREGVPGTPQTIALSGPASEFVAGFNLNGIASTPDGKTLIVVNSPKGELYTVDAATGESADIDLAGGNVRTGDGILLAGKTLYVLQNGASGGVPNQIAVIRLSSDLSEGRIVDTISSPLFETATTLAKRGRLLLAVNAQFAGAPIDARAEVVLLRDR